MKEEVWIEIDGVSVTAKRGQTILDAAEAGGVWIPHLCHLKGLTPHGSCRLCVVRVDGRMQAACVQPVSDGMTIENASSELTAIRRGVLGLLFAEGNHVCPACERSGDCELQAIAYRLSFTAPPAARRRSGHAVDATHPDAVLDRNRCVLCGRCERASRELDGKQVFGFVGRSAERRLAVASRTGLGGTDLAGADAALDACPVGALVRRGKGFSTPVGSRSFDHRPSGTDGPTDTDLEERRPALAEEPT